MRELPPLVFDWKPIVMPFPRFFWTGRALLGVLKCKLRRGHLWDWSKRTTTSTSWVCNRCECRMFVLGETKYRARIHDAGFKLVHITYEKKEQDE